LWTRLLGLCLGSEILAVFGVLAGFFCGLALGAWVVGRKVQALRRPVRVFAVLEILAAGFAVLSPYWLNWLAGALPAWPASPAGAAHSLSNWALAVGLSALALLPGTFCMGGTLVALLEARKRVLPADPGGKGLGRLYGANTFGAVLGTLATIYWVLPALGFAWSAVVLAGLGVLAALFAMGWRKRITVPARREADSSPGRNHLPTTAVYLLAAVTGLLGLGLEVVGVRVAAQILQNTVFTFANVLTIYLLGTTLGAWCYGALAARVRTRSYKALTVALLWAMALCVLMSAALIKVGPALLVGLAPEGSAYARHLAAELLVAGALFLFPTVVMGALFTHLVGMLPVNKVGTAYALNTLGAALAPLAFGLGAIPLLEYSSAFYAVAFGYAGLFIITGLGVRSRPLWLAAGAFIFVGLQWLAPASLSLAHGEDGFVVIRKEEGLLGSVLVTEKERPAPGKPLRRLRVGQDFRMGGGAASFAERRMGHLPLFLAPRTDRVLFLGVGTGATASAAMHHPVKHADAVELVPEIISMLPYFRDINDGVHKAPRVTFHAVDARRFVVGSGKTYDLIIGDLFHPARDGAGGLFSREHFGHVKEALNPEGLFVQWLPLSQIDPTSFKTIVRTFLSVFEQCHSLLGVYNVEAPTFGLVGYKPGQQDKPWQLPLKPLIKRFKERPAAGQYVDQVRDLLGAHMLDRQALRKFAGEGPLNTDLNPRVLFDAPRAVYEKRRTQGRENLRAVLALRQPVAKMSLTAVDAASREFFWQHLQRYVRASTLYLRGELARLGDDQPKAMAHYFEAFAEAPEFTPARGMLNTIGRQSVKMAHLVFPKMIAVGPSDPALYQAYLSALKDLGDHEGARVLLESWKKKYLE